MFKDRVLRRIFRPKQDEVTEEWRKLHNEELSYLYSSPNNVQVIKIKMNEMGEICSMCGGEERCIKGFGGKTRGKETI